MQELIVREFSFHQLNANLLWPGTFSFAEWLVQHRSWMDGRRVLELGRYGLWDWTMWFFLYFQYYGRISSISGNLFSCFLPFITPKCIHEHFLVPENSVQDSLSC